ncbi:hypothetical protein [Goodfellowiella coeruleoviolacea]|uniref:YtxH domain-containing protein n=1 Tax=Goodfellowiella coeruleoviolacea TaxID=334858 RepID=A0AAE3KG83_9PSEU|nr:hypothetical protein [Goodfellowiella coeruleoviolacea]MCP2165214.1 hypothetical protein [Goodfellowiella coeruleoviolacea]
MKGILFGAAVGYVLGARAGRQRYDQLVRAYRRLIDHPVVQGAAGVVRAKVGEWTGLAGRDAGTEGTAAVTKITGADRRSRSRDSVIPRA